MKTLSIPTNGKVSSIGNSFFVIFELRIVCRKNLDHKNKNFVLKAISVLESVAKIIEVYIPLKANSKFLLILRILP